METNPSTPGTSEDVNEEYEEFPNEISDFNDDDAETNKHSLIQEIQDEIAAETTISSTSTTVTVTTATATTKINGAITKSDSFSNEKGKDFDNSSTSISTKEKNIATTASSSSLTSTSDINESSMERDDYLHDKEWLMQKKHIFVLSSAGKPIYSLHGNEDKLATLFGVLLALVSFVQSSEDSITSIHANGMKIVFLVRNSLILVAVSRTNLSVHQLQMQLTDVYNQILSTLTYSHMTNIFEKRKNFDLRRLLAGSERLIDHLLVKDSNSRKISNNVFIFLTNSVRIMPLSSTVRNNITNAIQSNCSKIKNLVFALLIANNKLIALVRMKKYSIHPADLRLILNLIECSESFKTAESWTPICLPKFDQNGFLHAHVSYLSEDCQACLLLLSVDRDVFFTLSDARRKITEKLRRTHCLEAINDEMNSKGINLNRIAVPEIRHFIYKLKSNSQLLCSEITLPYTIPKEFERLQSIYYDMYDRIHNTSKPLKLIYEVHEKEIVLAWITAFYELYAVFEPTIDKNVVIKVLDKLLRWIAAEEDVVFIKNHPTF